MLPTYAITHEVDSSEADSAPAPDIRDVQILLALTELETSSTSADTGRRYPGYLYQYYYAQRPITPDRQLSIVDVYNRRIGKELPNPAPYDEDYLLARFCRDGREPNVLHPTLKILNGSATLVMEMLERSRDAVEIRLVRGGNPIDYHLFVCEKRTDSPPSGPMNTTTVQVGNELVLRQPNYGTELATFSLPSALGEVEVQNDLFTIREMLDQLKAFYEWMSSIHATEANN